MHRNDHRKRRNKNESLCYLYHKITRLENACSKDAKDAKQRRHQNGLV